LSFVVLVFVVVVVSILAQKWPSGTKIARFSVFPKFHDVFVFPKLPQKIQKNSKKKEEEEEEEEDEEEEEELGLKTSNVKTASDLKSFRSSSFSFDRDSISLAGSIR
jgi:hypothetical protein